MSDWDEFGAAGHRTGTAFFRWLHADIAEQPRCGVGVADEVA